MLPFPGFLAAQAAASRPLLYPRALSEGQFYSPPESFAGKVTCAITSLPVLIPPWNSSPPSSPPRALPRYPNPWQSLQELTLRNRVPLSPFCACTRAGVALPSSPRGTFSSEPPSALPAQLQLCGELEPCVGLGLNALSCVLGKCCPGLRARGWVRIRAGGTSLPCAGTGELLAWQWGHLSWVVLV